MEASVKAGGLRSGMKCRKKAKAEPYRLSTSPGPLAGFYFSCGPLAALGFFIGGLQGFVLAIIGNAVLWFLIAWRRDKKLIRLTPSLDCIFYTLSHSKNVKRK